MEIITLSHINEDHAASASFPQAQTADGRFSWFHALDGYVAINCRLTGLSDNTRGKSGWHQVYLQYGSQDAEVSPALLAEARAFSNAVSALREARRRAAERAVTAPMSIELPQGDPATTWMGDISMDAPGSIF